MRRKCAAFEPVSRTLLVLLLIIRLGAVASGQSAEPGENQQRERQSRIGLNLLRDVVLKEAANLRLAENRAQVYRSAAIALFKIDPEESGRLLEQAVDQIDTALADLQAAGALRQYRVEDLRRVRDEVVLALSEQDPVRALKAIHADNGKPEPENRRTPLDPQLEWLILQKGATVNPALVFETAMKSLSGGTLSTGLVDTWIALRGKNPEMGRKLGGEIVARLRGESPDPHSPAGQIAFALMADIWSRQQSANLDASLLDESSIRQLVSFVADILLAEQNPTSSGFFGDLTRFTGVIENYVPVKALHLRSRLAKLPPQLPFGPPDMKELDTFLQARNYDQAANWAKKAPAEARQHALYRVAEAQLENGQLDLARSFVSSHIADAATREEFLGRLASAEVQIAAAKGDEKTTRELIPHLPSGYDRLSTLLSLAKQAAESGDREKASAIIEEARALPCEKSERLKNELIVAEACLKIDITKSLDIVAAHIETLNVLLGASAVLDGYFGPESIHGGEMRYFGPSPLFPAVVTLCDLLGKIAVVDSDQALRLARSIARPELQTLAILTISQHMIS